MCAIDAQRHASDAVPELNVRLAMKLPLTSANGDDVDALRRELIKSNLVVFESFPDLRSRRSRSGSRMKGRRLVGDQKSISATHTFDGERSASGTSRHPDLLGKVESHHQASETKIISTSELASTSRRNMSRSRSRMKDYNQRDSKSVNDLSMPADEVDRKSIWAPHLFDDDDSASGSSDCAVLQNKRMLTRGSNVLSRALSADKERLTQDSSNKSRDLHSKIDFENALIVQGRDQSPREPPTKGDNKNERLPKSLGFN